jgi:hypothetical protein
MKAGLSLTVNQLVLMRTQRFVQQQVDRSAAYGLLLKL